MNPAGLRDLPELTEASRLPPQAHGMFTRQLSPLNPSHMEYAFLSGVPATSANGLHNGAPSQRPGGRRMGRPRTGCLDLGLFDLIISERLQMQEKL